MALRASAVALVAAFVLFGISIGLERAQRTSVAPAVILGYDWPSSPHLSIKSYRQIRYAFVVGGSTYSGSALQHWSIPQLESAKVCYDPGDPNNNALTLSTAGCS